MIRSIFQSKTLPHKKYSQLLIVFIINFIVAPFLKGTVGRFFSSAILLYAIIIIVKTFSKNRTWLRLYIGIAVLVFAFEIAIRFSQHSVGILSDNLLIYSVYAVYLGIAILLILRDVVNSQPITADTIRGSICVYLLMGFFWALLYTIIAIFDKQAFSQTAVEANFYAKAIHFSFTTLTTLGFGDIIPVSTLATVIANSEAVIGQLYPSTLIAILVNNYTSQ